MEKKDIKIHFKSDDEQCHAAMCAIYGGNQIVFTAIENGGGQAQSTIDCAEKIIRTIALKEGIDPQEYTFYDLQTMQGYRHYKPGQYCFSKLKLQWENEQITYVGWQDGHCSDTILEDFGGYIRGSDFHRQLENMAEVRGGIRTLIGDERLCSSFQDMIDLQLLAEEVFSENQETEGLKKRFNAEIVEVAEKLCYEQGIKPWESDRFKSLPRTTRLGKEPYLLFEKICDWLIKERKEFREAITPILFAP